MRTVEEIRRKLPYVIGLFGGTFGSEITVGKSKGSVVFTFNESGYEHVSFRPYNGKMPTWNDMCEIKDIFFDEEEEAYQIMSKRSEYVNIVDNCLHIWRPANGLTLGHLVCAEMVKE